MEICYIFEKGKEIEAASELINNWCIEHGMDNPHMIWDIKLGDYEAVYKLIFKREDKDILEEANASLNGLKEGKQKKDQGPEGPGP